MLFDALTSEATVLTVGELTAYVRSSFLQNPLLQDVWVRGEVTGANLSRSGHLFYSLRDSDALIKGVVWAPLSRHLHGQLQDGTEVLAHGRLDLYPLQGVYQLYTDEVVPVGAGLAYLEFERIRVKLEREGLFDTDRKRPLPRFPRLIGVVTSARGAARRDIENVIAQRWPVAEILLAPTGVQGDGAVDEIVAALTSLARRPVDVVIVARGGGDKDALWCFNAEAVARAIVAMPVPVICGIGHETDFTIADFVADLRAPTPSAAAAAAVPDRRELAQMLAQIRSRVARLVLEVVSSKRLVTGHALRVLRRSSPEYVLATRRQALEDLSGRLVACGRRLDPEVRRDLGALAVRLRSAAPRLAEPRQRTVATGEALARAGGSLVLARRAHTENIQGRLTALAPLATLQRGYAIVHQGDFDGPVLTDSTGLRSGEAVAVRLRRGGALATINSTIPEPESDGGPVDPSSRS